VKLQLDTAEPITDAIIALVRGYPLKKVDEHTFELTLKKGETANDTVRKLTSVGIGIVNVRNPGSRLEEVFVNLIERK
jgi:ABC-2 type transport system ATP-binding protein